MKMGLVTGNIEARRSSRAAKERTCWDDEEDGEREQVEARKALEQRNQCYCGRQRGRSPR